VFKIHELRELIRMIDQSDIQEFKLDHEGTRLILKKQSKGAVIAAEVPQVHQPAPVQQLQVAANEQQATLAAVTLSASTPTNNAAVADKDLQQIKSPMVGTFYRSPSPEADPYVKVGDKINEESVVCIVEAMKLFNEIEAEVKGEIVEVLVENGQLVEYGQPLFLVTAR